VERVSAEDIRRIGERQGWRCPRCGVSIRHGYHVDHIRALSRGGRHELSNLQLLCPRDNLLKGSR
jgi:5-methylcytosine-specific restriction endonuclease McrA